MSRGGFVTWTREFNIAPGESRVGMPIHVVLDGGAGFMRTGVTVFDDVEITVE